MAFEWVELDNLIDPKLWFSKARVFSNTCSLIKRESGNMVFSPDDLPINAVPYLSGIASELYMKGYLISKKQIPEVVRRFNHRLQEIRLKCLEYGDKRFENRGLIFLTDTCMVSFPEFDEALGILEEISID